MCLKDRVSEYCKIKNIAISRFEKDSGLSNGYFNQVKKRPSLDKIESIERAFPDLNKEWLLTGEGEMLLKGDTAIASGDSSVAVNHNSGSIATGDSAVLRERVAMLERLLEEKDKLLEEKERTIQIFMKK